MDPTEVASNTPPSSSVDGEKKTTTKDDLFGKDCDLLPVIENYECRSTEVLAVDISQTIKQVFTALLQRTEIQLEGLKEMHQFEEVQRAVAQRTGDSIDEEKIFAAFEKKINSSEDFLLDKILLAKNTDNDTRKVAQSFVVTFLTAFGVQKEVAYTFATEVIVRKYEDTFIKSAVMSGFGKKMFGYWERATLSNGVVIYCVIKDAFLQYARNYIMEKKLYLSFVPNPDYYGRLAQAVWDTLPNMSNLAQKKELLTYIIKHEFDAVPPVPHKQFETKFQASQMPWNKNKYTPVIKSIGDDIYVVSDNDINNTNFDVVFLHGLDGDHITTWIARDDKGSFWPKAWLAQSLPSARVLSVRYAVSSSKWTGEGHSMVIEDRAFNLLERLYQVGVGSRPCCFVTHSMGGLVCKQMLVESKLRKNREVFVNNTKLVVFYATPHKGSKVADYASVLQEMARTSAAVDDLEYHARHLQALDRLFNLLEMKVLNIGETKKTFGVMVVDRDSSKADCYVDANHSEICKPKSPADISYSAVLDIVVNTMMFSSTSNQNAVSTENPSS